MCKKYGYNSMKNVLIHLNESPRLGCFCAKHFQHICATT